MTSLAVAVKMLSYKAWSARLLTESPDTSDPELSTDSHLEDTDSTPVKKSVIMNRGLYVLGYVFQGMRRHKRRSFSLILGILIGVALVTSVFVWTDTGTRVAINDYFDQTPFHYYAVQRGNPFYNDPNAIFPVQEWVDEHPSTRQSWVVYSSVGFIDIDELRPDHNYLPWPYLNGIKDCEALFVDNDFLDRLEPSVTYEGNFRLSGASVLVSRRVVEDAETILGMNITVGSQIDISIARFYYSHPAWSALIGDTYAVPFLGLRVAGIYEIEPVYDAFHEAFPTSTRINWGPFTGAEVVMGLLDSILLPSSLLDAGLRDNLSRWVNDPRLLVEVNPVYFHQLGLENTVSSMDSLFIQIEENFDVFLGGRSSLVDLHKYIIAYSQRRSMGILVTPIILLSILLTTFTTTLFLSGRRMETGILRSRGASFRQLYGTLLTEFLILAFLGLGVGALLGILVGCLIPSATGFMQFNLVEFLRYLALAQLPPIGLLTAALICVVPSAIYSVFVIRTFLKTELYQTIRGTNNHWRPGVGIQVAYVIGASALVFPLFIIVQTYPLTVDLAVSFFIISVGLWLILCDAGSRIIKPSVAAFSKIFRPIFGQKGQLFAKSVKVRRTRIIPLLIILILTFSVTIFSAVEAQTYQQNLNRQIEFYVGGDIRIYSGPVPAQRVQELIDLPQIETASAFIETRADYGVFEFRLLGIDPIAYSQAGNWDDSSTLGSPPASVLRALAENPSGIIFPKHMADYYGKHTGDTVDIVVWDQKIVELETKTFEIVGEFVSAPGFGYANPSDPSASVSPTPGFGFQKPHTYAFVHEDYFLVEVPSWKVYDYVNLTQMFIAQLRPGINIQNALNRVNSLDFVYESWTPQNFDLAEAYTDGYLFSQGVVSLLSVGFLAALAISIVALTIFVNTIVGERRSEYAIMRALGGTRRQVTAIVFGEFLGLILAAFFVALILGVAFSQMLMFALLRLFPQPYVVPFEIVYPFTLLIAVLVLVIIGMLAGAYLPARKAGKVEVSKILRNL